MTSCKHCGQNLDSVPAGDPCPNCGGTGRNHVLTVEPGVFVLTGADANLTILRHWTSLLQIAESLYAAGYFGVALILAQSACEIVMTRAVAAASKKLGRKAKSDSYSPNRGDHRKTYRQLTGDDLEQQPFFTDYCQMASRRNKCVHEGEYKRITQTESRDGLDAAKQLIDHVEAHIVLGG